MAREFNYERAWHEFLKREFEKLPKCLLSIYDAVCSESEKLKQVGATEFVTGASDHLKRMFRFSMISDLAYASKIIYYYGHMSPVSSVYNGGAYWKFRCVAHVVAEEVGVLGEFCNMEKNYEKLIDSELDRFKDHKEGTDFDNDEIPNLLRGADKMFVSENIKRISADYVEHYPDVFCIGKDHLRLRSGMYLDPNVAPCYKCRQPYSNHTSKRVVILKMTEGYVLTKKDVEKITFKVLDVLGRLNIKMDRVLFSATNYEEGIRK